MSNYWIDDPPSKPYSPEFLELTDLNILYNFVQSPTHISGHTLDLIITLIHSNLVDHVEIVPIDSSTSDYNLLVITMHFLRPVTLRNYKSVDEEAISQDIVYCVNTRNFMVQADFIIYNVHSFGHKNLSWKLLCC